MHTVKAHHTCCAQLTTRTVRYPPSPPPHERHTASLVCCARMHSMHRVRHRNACRIDAIHGEQRQRGGSVDMEYVAVALAVAWGGCAAYSRVCGAAG